jgi:hypothetical protein
MLTLIYKGLGKAAFHSPKPFESAKPG